MTSERYEKIGQLFHAALELPAKSRVAFLSGACGLDVELRQEVETLLEAHDKAGDFATAPPSGMFAAWLASVDPPGDLSGRIGAYEVLSPIGRGGMGEVYLAHDTRLGRNVAVKVLQAPLTSNPDAARRFEQEARAASSLNHPNIVTIYEIGDLRDRRFIAMEFVEGRSLAAMIGRPMEAATLSKLGVQLARALAVAHAAGIVHRDIKPENVIVREDGYLKVLDFGLARLARLPTVEDADAITNPNLLLGTPRYMSPEQARGETASEASDVFSLGVVLYELATGRHPFVAARRRATTEAEGNRRSPCSTRSHRRPRRRRSAGCRTCRRRSSNCSCGCWTNPRPHVPRPRRSRPSCRHRRRGRWTRERRRRARPGTVRTTCRRSARRWSVDRPRSPASRTCS